jgi:subtilase family serine protease
MANLRVLSLYALAGALLGLSASSAAQTNPIVVTPSSRIVNPVDNAQLVTLHGTVSPLATRRNDLGAAPDGLQLDRMHLVLKRSDSQEAALTQLIGEMHTPGSPNYHKWLTPDQFGAQFGPSDQDIAAVTTWLTNQGFSVRGVNPGHQTIEISGSVAQLRNAFHTQIHQYAVNGQTHYSNVNDPQIPAALAPVVGGFVSLNNFPVHRYLHSFGKAQYDPKTNKATPQWTMGTTGSLSFVLAPQDYAVQYDLAPLYNGSVNGAGQTIAIINDSNINVDLVNQFRSLFGLPNNPPQVIIDGNDPGVDGINNPDGPNGDSVEAYLDVEWAGAVAPNATIDLVIAGNTPLQNGLILAAERAVYSNIAPVISVSFGNCEMGLGANNAFLSSLWQQAAAQGITVTVSTGDAGSAGCDNDNTQSFAVNGQAVNGFASTPYNVAVGGTDFFYSQYNGTTAALNAQIATYWNTTPSNSAPTVSLLQPVPEQPWNASQYGLNINSYYTTFQDTTIAGGGGGASNAAICAGNTYSSTTGLCTSSLSGYPKPAWQTGVTGIPADGVRDTPDVSLFASSGINASFYPLCASDGDCQPASGGTVQISGVGGTSASTPAFAGIMALVNQKYGRQGQANTVLYPLAKQFPASFHDVTVGTNSVPCEILPTPTPNCIAVSNPIVLTSQSGSITEGQIGSGTTPQYNAAAGYDLASGLGTIDAANLVNNWNKVTLAATTTTMTPTPANGVSLTSIPHGTSVAIAGTVTGSGTPTGDVALMTDSTEQAQQFATKYALSGGSYTGTTSNLPGGTYNIWAQYGGDSVNGMSTSTKTQITVTPETSAIDFNMFNVATSPATIYRPGSGPGTTVDYGTQFLLSALVAPSSQAAALETCIVSRTGCSGITFTSPTGTVTFADNGSTLNTAAINNEGDAEYNAPFSVGAHSVTAAYAGDKSYNAAATTAPITFTVVKDTPAMFIGASNLISTSSLQVVGGTNQPTVLNVLIENNAQVSAATNTAIYPVPIAAPTGTIAVTSSLSGVSGTLPVSAGVDPSTGAQVGLATVTIPASTAAGTYTLGITYSGDSNYQGVSGNGSIQIVSPNGLKSTTTTATMSGSISPNSSITITGTVTGSSTTAPTGGIIVYSSGNYLTQISISPGSGNVSNFAFKLNSAVLSQGANFITLQYTGDNTYAPSAFTLNGGSSIGNPLADFAMVPSSSNVPVTTGSNGTSTINLASVNGFAGTVNLVCRAAAGVTCTLPSSATLSSGGNTSATLTVNAPSGAINGNYNVLVIGTDASGMYIHTLGFTAMVSGTSGTTPSFTLTKSQDISVTAGATTGNTSTISVNPTNGFTGTVGLTCAVTTAPSGATSPITCAMAPTSVSITSTALSSILTVSSTSSTTPGSYAVTVTGVSGSITQTDIVNVTVLGGTFALSNSGNITVTRGATSGNTSTITVTPSGGFTGAVSLSCAITPAAANAPATCALNPTSVTITSGAQTSTLSIGSTANTAFNEPLKLFWPATGGTVLAVLFFFVPRRRRNWLAMTGLLLVLVSGIVIGCGGGSNNNNNNNTGGNTGTTPGTYTVTVTGTSGTMSKTTTVTLTVN